MGSYVIFKNSKKHSFLNQKNFVPIYKNSNQKNIRIIHTFPKNFPDKNDEEFPNLTERYDMPLHIMYKKDPVPGE